VRLEQRSVTRSGDPEDEPDEDDLDEDEDDEDEKNDDDGEKIFPMDDPERT
jgi:hypothetical protein